MWNLCWLWTLLPWRQVCYQRVAHLQKEWCFDVVPRPLPSVCHWRITIKGVGQGMHTGNTSVLPMFVQPGTYEPPRHNQWTTSPSPVIGKNQLLGWLFIPECHVTIMWLSCDCHVTVMWLSCDGLASIVFSFLLLALFPAYHRKLVCERVGNQANKCMCVYAPEALQY